MDKIRWGILGTGGIARKFAEALKSLPDAELAAVGSRTQEAAEAFGRQYGFARRHGTYEALMADPGVDVVYVATPHPLHKENSLGCLRGGKAVLCEKPFTINAGELREVIACAREKNLFLMEAMWTRYFPAAVKLRSLIAEGAIGEVRLVLADFGFHPAFDPKSRLFDIALGGGALLDLGVYPVSFASMVFGGPPQRVLSTTRIGSTGVDEQSAAILEYPDGKQALVSCTVLADTPKDAHVVGTKGRLRLERPFWFPSTVTLTPESGKETEFKLPFTGNGYGFEAIEVMKCLREGKKESAAMPLAESLTVMETLDKIRAPWGLKYPGE